MERGDFDEVLMRVVLTLRLRTIPARGTVPPRGVTPWAGLIRQMSFALDHTKTVNNPWLYPGKKTIHTVLQKRCPQYDQAWSKFSQEPL